MALYVSAARRTRRTVIIAVGAAVIAAALGFAVGRQQVPSVNERVTEIQQRANSLATSIERLDIEYAQAVNGEGDDISTGVLRPLADDRRSLQLAMDEAPWVGADERSAILDVMAAAEQAARDRVPVEAFEERLAEAGATIRSVLGS